MLSASLSAVSVDGSISAYLMGTVCFGSKYHKTMSRFVRTNEDYLLSICAQSQTSVTFYDAYLRSAGSPFKFHWQSLPQCRTEHSRRLLKVQDGCTRSVGGFSHCEQFTCVGVQRSRGLLWFRIVSGIITGSTVFLLNVCFFYQVYFTLSLSPLLSLAESAPPQRLVTPPPKKKKSPLPLF